MIFSIPYALVTKDTYSEIEKLVPGHFDENDLVHYRARLPLKGKAFIPWMVFREIRNKKNKSVFCSLLFLNNELYSVPGIFQVPEKNTERKLGTC
jgi:hypothetical protein